LQKGKALGPDGRTIKQPVYICTYIYIYIYIYIYLYIHIYICSHAFIFFSQKGKALGPDGRAIKQPVAQRPGGKFAQRASGAEEEEERFWPKVQTNQKLSFY